MKLAYLAHSKLRGVSRLRYMAEAISLMAIVLLCDSSVSSNSSFER